MNSIVLSQFAFVLAAHARVLGMQAENKVREVQGHSPAYDEAAFHAEARQMEESARMIAADG